MLRTEGDFVRAVDMARDLTNLVMQYLALWHKHANGVNGLEAPSGRYRIVFLAPSKSDEIHFEILLAETISREEPVYYDSDSDYFSESWGASNISGYTTSFSTDIVQRCVKMPIAALMQSPEQMERSVIEIAAKDKVAKAEATRLAKVAALEKELKELQKS
jgi:hypothetical protein